MYCAYELRGALCGRLENCSRAMSVRCPAANEEALKRHNCNADGECEGISGVFSCKRGHCANLSEIYNCRPEVSGSFNIDAEKVSGQYCKYYTGSACLEGRSHEFTQITHNHSQKAI
jgi:hypothetical protein